MANKKLIVRTPRGAVITAKTKGGTVRARLVWDKGFGQRKTKNMMSAQEFIDSEVLRRSDPYTPKRTGALIRSGILGTTIGSGEVRYVAPYSRRLYYNPQYHFNGAPKRGAKWFERMKIDHKDAILRGAGKLAGKD